MFELLGVGGQADFIQTTPAFFKHAIFKFNIELVLVGADGGVEFLLCGQRQVVALDLGLATALLARERLESGGGSPTLLVQADSRLEAFQATLAAQPGKIACPRSGNDKPCRPDLAVLDDF